MAGVVKIDITESAEELQTVMTSQSTASERSKVQVLWWLKTGQVTTVTQAAAQGGHHRTTVSRWLSKYRDGGLEHLLAPPYRPRRISKLWRDSTLAVSRAWAGDSLQNGASDRSLPTQGEAESPPSGE